MFYVVVHLFYSDLDHNRWVEEQAQFVQTLSLRDRKHHTANDRFEMAMKKSPFCDDDKQIGETRKKILAEEEELKYLAFINEVANDILARGIYSNK